MITPQKHAAICQVVEAHLRGVAAATPYQAREAKPDDEDPDQKDYEQYGDVAVIPVHGVIEKHLQQMASAAPGCDLDTLNGMIDVAEMDESVGKIIFDFRTPGGSVVGVPESARKILRCEKETIAFTDSECCSGGMYLASQCQKFYATGSAYLGSIGVWCAYLDLSRQMAMEGENMQAISAGKHKLMGAYWKPLTADETALIQRDIDKIWGQFKTAVCAVRSCSEEGMGNGLVFDGEEACDRGLIDGDLEDMEDILNEFVRVRNSE
jgi:protease-4